MVATGAVDTAIATRRDRSRATETASLSARATLTVLAAWAIVIVVAHVLLDRLEAAGANLRLHAAPLHGRFELRVNAGLLAAVAVGVLAGFGWPRLAPRPGWRRLLLPSAAAAAGWAVSVAPVYRARWL